MIKSSSFKLYKTGKPEKKGNTLKFYGLFIIFLTSFSPVVYSQFSIAENAYFHFDGISGQKNYLVFDLHKFGDSIYGSYYHKSDGQLHYFNGKMNSRFSLLAIEKNGDSIIGEFISIHKMKGYFSAIKNNVKNGFLLSESDYFGSMTFESFRYARTYDFADKPLFPKYKVDLMLLYPEGHPNRTVQDSVQDYILGYYFGQNILFNAREKMLSFLSNYYYQNYTAHYKSSAFEYRSSLLKWMAILDVQILFNENFVLTICIKQNISNWNIDPTWDKIYLVFNLKTGQKLTADDLFMPGYEGKLKTLLTTQLQKQFNVTNSLQSEGFYKSTVAKYDNIFVTREGIGFHYNPGELAPAIFGEIDLFFKFDELKDILLTRGLVYTLVQ
jgi:hypothetical protein